MNRLVLMFLGLAAVVGGGLYFFYGVHTPGRDFRLAREEIERWQTRADKVRTCLLGTAPASPIAAEALAIRELTNNPPEFKKCTAGIGELSRGDAEDTGIKEVETEWKSIASAATRVANAFAHLFDPGTAAKQQAVDDLGNALDQLDIAQRNLRLAAEMDPPPSGVGLTSLPKAELVPLGTRKRARLSAWLRPSAGGMVVLVDGAGSPAHQLALVPGEAPRRVPFHSDVRPSVGDPTWAVQSGDGELAHGKLTAEGKLDTPITKAVGDKKAVPHLLFTLGNADSGAVAFIPDAARTPPQVAVIRSFHGVLDFAPPPAPAPAPAAGSAAAPPPPPPPAGMPPTDADDYSFAIDPPNRGLIAWSSKDVVRGMIVRPGVAAKPVELGSGHTGLSCLTASHGWVASDDEFIAFDDTTATPQVIPGHELVGCDATSVLLRQAGHRYTVCSTPSPSTPGALPSRQPSCRVVELAAGGDAIPGLSKGLAIAVASRQKVVAVWTEKQKEPRYFVLPATFTPKLVHANDKVLDVLGETADGLAIARVAL